jgi:DNA/RNA-binding domain of Phe-tRNA-synthetase-like protein
MIELRWSLDHPALMVGLVQAEPVRVAPSDPVLRATIDEAVASAQQEPWPPESIRAAIRDLLRRGGFKPTGRSKPASEYLAKAATNDAFPLINNLVDINNLVSLRTGWPCSILDRDLACPLGSEALELRYGRKEEQFVFNSAGQSIDVGGLICVTRIGGEPIANAVKDSMATKTRDSTSRLLFVTYTSRRVASESEVQAVLDGVADLLSRHAGAERCETAIVVRSS